MLEQHSLASARPRRRWIRCPLFVYPLCIQLVALFALRADGPHADAATTTPDGRTPTVLRQGSGVVPASFFGMHMHRALRGTSWPRAPIAAWRLWDTAVAWPWLEPTRGKVRWDDLDRLIELADKRGAEVLLPLGMSPAWASTRPTEPSAYGRPGVAAEPASMADWRRHVSAVATRYAGRVRAFEIWNEPNVRHFYSGSVERMVTLCREAHAIIKRADPKAIVVSPAPATRNGLPWLDRFLAAGGADCFDVVGFHFYVEPGPPEDLPALVADVRQVMTKHGVARRPLWNTESGWFIAAKQPAASPDVRAKRSTLSQDDAAAYLARALLLSRAAGIARFYWYAWDNYDMGLIERDGSEKPAVQALVEIQRWLVGANLRECSRSTEGTWICSITRASKPAWIVWNPQGTRPFSIPPAWRATTHRDLRGARHTLQSRSLPLGPMPELIERTAAP